MKYEIGFSLVGLPQLALGAKPDGTTTITVSRFQSLASACFDLGVISQERQDRRVLFELLVAFYGKEQP